MAADTIDPIWKQALREGDTYVADFFKDLNAKAKEASDLVPHAFYTELSTVDASQKVVTVEMLVMSMNLLTARVVMQALPDYLKSQINTIRDNFIASKAKSVLKLIAKKVPDVGQVLSLMERVRQVVASAGAQSDIETKIRKIGEAVRKDLSQGLNQSSREKGVHDVRTRHKSEKKKRSFKGCKSH